MRKALFILSGGQDSATCLALSKCEEAYALTFNYGQRHHRELLCAAEIGHLGGVKQHFYHKLQIPSISALTVEKEDINLPHPKDADLPASFVPGRNLLFLTLAAGYAYNLDVRDLVIGVSQEDEVGYPDCRAYFITAAEMAINRAFNAGFSIHAPCLHITKAESIRRMIKANKLQWLMHTHTCYNGKFPPCGECSSCKVRAKAFEEVGIPDPLLFGMGGKYEPQG
jgi:7-cyano-7-deazaguanine synthase